MSGFDNAIDYLKMGNVQKAEQILLSLIAQTPRNFDVLHMLAVVSSQLKKFTDVEAYFKSAESFDNRYPPLYHNLVYFRQIQTFCGSCRSFGLIARRYCFDRLRSRCF